MKVFAARFVTPYTFLNNKFYFPTYTFKGCLNQGLGGHIYSDGLKHVLSHVF